MATSQLKHKYPVFLSPLLENQDFKDFWYHKLMKNKNFETFPGHGILIRFAALELIGKFSSNYHQVSYLLKNLEGSLWYFQSKSSQYYEELSKILLSLLQEVRVFFAFPKQQVSNSTTYNPPDEIVGLFIDFSSKF
ncbi:putative late blight resistance proteinR1B-17 [Abeliophyllum distichum]|uniref:Late blight resistance proteinR1B-17 n=1 Tax=Abeliophyllum distichum TaxID=126358 RepID=A0ABD1RXX5_9LAMI